MGKKVSWVELQQKQPDFGTVFLSLLHINALCLDTFLNKEEISRFIVYMYGTAILNNNSNFVYKFWGPKFNVL